MSLEDLVQRALTEQARDMSAVPDVEALVARGIEARRRRRLAIVASMVATVVIGAVAVGQMPWDTAEPAPVSGIPSPPTSIEATATAGPGRGTGFFGGSAPEVPVTFTMPAGWYSDGAFVSKSDADPVFGLVFMDVGNIYADGCRWEPVDPPPGPTVDDLVSAYAKLTELRVTPARDVTVDGFDGKQIQVTIPDYNENVCKEGKFGIFLITSDLAGDAAPNLWAQAAKQQNTLWILDVDGTRLVILAGDPGNMSAQDRTDLDGIVGSLQIG